MSARKAKKRWENITGWIGVRPDNSVRQGEDQEEWRTIVARSSQAVPIRSLRPRNMWDVKREREFYL